MSGSRRRKEYFQDHWEEFDFSTKEVSGQPELHYQQQQQQPIEPKTKKSRGNRKLQRFRAKLKKQGLDDETIRTMINEYNNPRRPDNERREEELIELHDQVLQERQRTTQANTDKRKRESRSAGVTTSLSTITIAQPLTKRHRSTTVDNLVNSKNIDEFNSNNMPKYLNVPDSVFKNMLSNSLEGMENIIQSLDTHEKLQYTRVYAHLVNNMFYLKLKQDFWNNYYQVMVTEGIWPLQMSKQMIRENNLHRLQITTQDKMETRQNMIIELLQQAENELNQHKQLAVNHSIDINRLSTVIPAFVRKGQHKLSQDFQRKKLLLQLDANEYRLVQAFYNLKPTDDQICSAKLIWQATSDKQQAEEHVVILKQRIYTKRLPSSYNLLDHSIDNIEKMLSKTILDQNKRTTLSEERKKMIAKYKFDMMTLTIRTAEELVRRHTEIITNEKQKLIDSTHQKEPLPKSLVTILNAIAARQSNIIKRAQIIVQQKGWHRRSNVLNVISHILPSSPIIEVASSLSSRQLAFLANGPKYIPACQSRFSYLSIDIIIEKEYQKLVELFTVGLNDNHMSATDQRSKEFFASTKELLRQLLTKPLPRRLLNRARYDHKMLRSTYRTLKSKQIVIRKTDKSKVLHLASANSYHHKSLEHMQKTKAYKEIETGINPCMNHLHQVLTLLNPLLKNKAINRNIWKQYMYPNIRTIELAYLYFIPKPHKVGTPLRPIVSSMHAPATGVSHFLDQILRPIFNRVARQTTFINGIHFVRRMELYRDIGRLSSTTTFITFDVADLYTMIPRDGALLVLEQFLYKYARNGRINNMTIDAIMKMAHLVLDTNCFLFEGKYYQQIRGGAMGSPFTMTLANIYMLKWEQQLITHQKTHNELYGRYIDDVFMTTNLPLHQINVLLDRENVKDENIRISRSIGSNVEFLDVCVDNNQGTLKTTVFHKPAAEPYIVPFLSDHPRHVHRNTVKGALFRAVRLCSDVQDFDKERLNIELTLLLNGYPSKFVSYHFKRFFEQNNVMSLMEHLNNDIYRELHQKLIHQPTRKEREQEDISSYQRTGWNKKEIRVYFTFESGPMLDFKREIRRLWKKYYIYDGSLMNSVNLKIGTRGNKSLSQLLIKKKPPKAMLTNVDSSNTT